MAPRDRHCLSISVDARELKPDLETVDLLARFALLAARHGYAIALLDPAPALVELIVLAGLSEPLLGRATA